MRKLVLLRHGESLWNKENRFTGWTDVPLTPLGEAQAREAGRLLKAADFRFDVAYTSVLKRAIKTLWLALEEMDRTWTPIENHWRLNERHYGALQGLNKAETAAKFGDEQVLIWRRSYDIPPPPLEPDDPRNAHFDERYAGLPPVHLPLTECLKDTVARFMPLWEQRIAPAIRDHRSVIIAAHGNSLRAIVKILEDMGDAELIALNIPTGVPLVYDLDDSLKAVEKRYLGDQAAIASAMQAMANQGKAKA